MDARANGDERPRALVAQPAFLGDAVLATSLVETLDAAGYRVDLLVRAGNESLFVGHPTLGALLIWEKRRRKYAHWAALTRRIRTARYSVAVTPHRYASTGLWVALSGARHRFGFRENPLHRAFTYSVSHRFGDGTHEVDRNLALLEPLGIPRVRQPKLYPRDADYVAAAIPERAYVTVSPSSVWFTKTYPAERWIELIRRVPRAYGVHLLGAPGDRRLCSDIAEASGRPCAVRAGELSLLGSAALMGSAAMNYVNDSAPLHLASAMGAPVTAFFLNTSPAFGYGPVGERGVVLETPEPLACKPCAMTGRRACPKGHFRCSYIPPPPILELPTA